MDKKNILKQRFDWINMFPKQRLDWINKIHETEFWLDKNVLKQMFDWIKMFWNSYLDIGKIYSGNKYFNGKNTFLKWYSISNHILWTNIWFYQHTVEPHLSGLFSYPDKCIETNSHSSTESDSLIWKFGFPDSQSGNRGVRMNEAPLYSSHNSIINIVSCW